MVCSWFVWQQMLYVVCLKWIAAHFCIIPKYEWEPRQRDMLKPVIVSAAFVLWFTTEEPTYEWDEENTNDHAEK